MTTFTTFGDAQAVFDRPGDKYTVDMNVFGDLGPYPQWRPYVVFPWVRHTLATPDFLRDRCVTCIGDRVIIEVTNGRAVYERKGHDASGKFIRLDLVEATWSRPSY